MVHDTGSDSDSESPTTGHSLQHDQDRRNVARSAVLISAMAAAVMVAARIPSAPEPMRTSILTGQKWIDELLDGHHLRIQEQLGVKKHVFRTLSNDLQHRGYLHWSRNGISPDEQLAIFLHLARTGCSVRMLAERFQRSNDTIIRYVHHILGMLVCTPFYHVHLHPPPDECPLEIRREPKLYPYFHHCRGAIDCSHVDSWVHEKDSARYRNRKGRLSQNVFAACDFGLRYTYICSGWEGSAADSAIFEYIRARDFAIPAGRYYLADAGFPICDVLMTPYRNVRYHLKEWSRGIQKPKDYKELFNLRHASARNVVERIFGVTKRRFSLMVASPEYNTKTQAMFVPAMCVLHNYIREHAPNEFALDVEDNLASEAFSDSETSPVQEISEEDLGFQISPEEKRRGEARRDRIAQQMWVDYQAVLAERATQ